MVVDGWKTEIEAAVDRAQQHDRTKLDRWFRREWHRAAAVDKWPEERQRRYHEWRQRQRQASEEDAWVDKTIREPW